MKRPIIEIDRDKCNGCGNCTTACAENALVLDEENKAVLVKEIYCDGLGACLDVCPVDALRVVEKECEDYDAKAAYHHVKKTRGEEAAAQVHRAPDAPKPAHGPMPGRGSGCPGSRMMDFSKRPAPALTSRPAGGSQPSALTQWPIQLHLISPHAPYFEDSDLLIAADCTAFSMGAFHSDLLQGKKLAIACPKLDDTGNYSTKLAELIRNNTIYSLTVVIMEVPCCSGLGRIVEEAVTQSGKNIAIKKIVITLDGAMKQ